MDSPKADPLAGTTTVSGSWVPALRSGYRRALFMKLKTMLITAGLLIFLGVGLYLGITEGIEPTIGSCTKYSIICLR